MILLTILAKLSVPLLHMYFFCFSFFNFFYVFSSFINYFINAFYNFLFRFFSFFLLYEVYYVEHINNLVYYSQYLFLFLMAHIPFFFTSLIYMCTDMFTITFIPEMVCVYSFYFFLYNSFHYFLLFSFVLHKTSSLKYFSITSFIISLIEWTIVFLHTRISVLRIVIVLINLSEIIFYIKKKLRLSQKKI